MLSHESLLSYSVTEWGLVARNEIDRVWLLYLHLLYHTFETTFFDPIMWGMTVGAVVAWPPVLIIAQLLYYSVFITRNVI